MMKMTKSPPAFLPRRSPANFHLVVEWGCLQVISGAGMLGAISLIGTSPSLIFPVGVFWMFQVPKRTPALYLRNGREVVFRRRRRRGPLERPGIPWIASGVLTPRARQK